MLPELRQVAICERWTDVCLGFQFDPLFPSVSGLHADIECHVHCDSQLNCFAYYGWFLCTAVIMSLTRWRPIAKVQAAWPWSRPSLLEAGVTLCRKRSRVSLFATRCQWGCPNCSRHLHLASSCTMLYSILPFWRTGLVPSLRLLTFAFHTVRFTVPEDKYCESFGHECVTAAEEVNNNWDSAKPIFAQRSRLIYSICELSN